MARVFFALCVREKGIPFHPLSPYSRLSRQESKKQYQLRIFVNVENSNYLLHVSGAAHDYYYRQVHVQLHYCLHKYQVCTCTCNVCPCTCDVHVHVHACTTKVHVKSRCVCVCARVCPTGSERVCFWLASYIICRCTYALCVWVSVFWRTLATVYDAKATFVMVIELQILGVYSLPPSLT